MDIVFATNNKNKLREIQLLLPGGFTVLSLDDIGCNVELPENQNTLEGNAKEKAQFIFRKYKTSCFADDTGLEVNSLGGHPGVFSARYAGKGRNAEENIQKVLNEMKGKVDRSARFRTVICCYINDKPPRLFEGCVQGVLTEKRNGREGFGYDPIFIPDGRTKTFAEMDIEEKNSISHRGEAISKLVDYLRSLL